jgi:hypothetical protein
MLAELEEKLIQMDAMKGAMYSEPNDLVGEQHNEKSYEGGSPHSFREWMEISMTFIDRRHPPCS